MRYTIDCGENTGKSIKQVLRNKFQMSAALVTSLKKSPDGITVNGERKFVNYILQSGDKLTVTLSETGSVNIEPVPMLLDILYEDEWLMAVNKPAYMAVHVSHGNVRDTLSNGVIHYLNRNGEEHMFHAVTRLDKNTSGVVLIAKNGHIHNLLSQSIQRGELNKEYVALVCGRLPDKKGEILEPIARESAESIKRCVRDDGAYAKTLYETVSEYDGISLVKLYPETGRTHQLRVHMAYMGTPIVGDDMYGADAVPQKRHFLHCFKVSFEHPVTHKNLEISAAVPKCFSDICGQTVFFVKSIDENNNL